MSSCLKPPLIFTPSSLSRFVALSPPAPFCHPTNRISKIFIGSKASKSCSSCHSSYTPSLNFSTGTIFKDFGCSKIGFREMGFNSFRCSAVSDGGVGGGNGGGFGSSGDGNSGGSGGEGGGGSKWSLLSWYLAALKKYPVLTKALTSAILTFIGDIICQLLVNQVTLDVKRAFIFSLVGFVLVGPVLHFWYLSLSKLVSTPGASGAFLRLLLDQFLFTPIFVGLFLSTLLTFEGRPSQITAKLQQEWWTTLLANWQLWIPFQFLNFLVVPQQFQVLAANIIALAWNVILSFKAHKEITLSK